MTEPMTITLKAMVDRGEQAAVSQAAALLESALSTAAGRPVVVRCRFEASLESLNASGDASVAITSLLPEVSSHPLPWAAVAERLSEDYRRLADPESAEPIAVFVCTVFRNIPADAVDAQSRLIRIRRLNLLAAELSREFPAAAIGVYRLLCEIASPAP